MPKTVVFENPDALTKAIRAMDVLQSESLLRQAAVAGIREIFYEVKLRAPVLDNLFGGGQSTWQRYGVTYYPGFLRDHIVIAFDKEVSVEGKLASYICTWSKDAFYGRFLEYGTSKMSPRPFLRPAYEAMKQAAVAAVNDVIDTKLKEAMNGQ